MNEYDPTSPDETFPDRLVSSPASEPSGDRISSDGGAAATPPPATPPDWAVAGAEQPRPRGIRRLLSNKRSRWIGAAALVCAAIGLSVGLATSPSATGTSSSATTRSRLPGPGSGGGFGPGEGGSNARSGPAAGGAAGTVGSVSGSGFTMSTSAGQKVTVDEASSTTYQKGTSSTSASAIATGEPVLVLGTTSGTTITASQVIVEPTANGSTPSTAATVVPFQRGAPTTAKQVGQIPSGFTQGSGTIVSGTAATKATEAALAAYPGGIVDRVVLLSDGEYNVHTIGVNWPHHVFVNQDFTVVGAE